MIISAAIISKEGNLFYSSQLPQLLQDDIAKHGKNFLYSTSISDNEIEFPYIETTNLRYIYKETGDLYWLLVTKLESEMFSDIHLLGKFVCTIMEYGANELNSQTITDEQRDLFYRHLWRPWDDDTHCPYCGCQCNHSPEFWEREFENRLQFLISIRDGQIDDNDVEYFNCLIAEAWVIAIKFSPKWSKLTNNATNIARASSENDIDSEKNSICSSEIGEKSISEETVIDGCRLKCRLEDIRIEVGRIQDPYLRLFAKRNLAMIDSNHAICSAPTFKDLDLNEPYDQSFSFENY